MTTPHEQQPATSGPSGGQATPEQAAAGVPGTPRVTTAPPRARWHLGRVPARLGRARTSTVVLAVVWLLVALLWLDVRPPSAQIAPTGDTTTGTAPRTTTAPARPSSSAPTTSPPTSTPVPRTTTAPSSPTTTAPAPAPAPAPSTAGASTSSPGTTAPTRTSPGTQGSPALPTTAAAPTS